MSDCNPSAAKKRRLKLQYACLHSPAQVCRHNDRQVSWLMTEAAGCDHYVPGLFLSIAPSQ